MCNTQSDERAIRPEMMEALTQMCGRLRIGHGYDIHPFDSNRDRALVLAGVIVSPQGGLAGRTDADVVSHAVTDAIVAAAGKGDGGTYLRAAGLASSSWRNSLHRLQTVVQGLKRAGVQILSVDCTIVCESPALAGHLTAMQDGLQGAVVTSATLKAKHGEGVSSIGRGDGIECHAVALVLLPNGTSSTSKSLYPSLGGIATNDGGPLGSPA